MTTKLLYPNLSYKIRGSCFKVWKQFGGAFKEKIVENALAIEFEKRQLHFFTQKRIDVYYDSKKVGTYVPDFVVEEKIILEIKRKSFLTKQDIHQFWNYLRGTKYRLGFLINFGDRELEIIRRIYG